MELRKRGSWMEDAFEEVGSLPALQNGDSRKRGVRSASSEIRNPLFLWSEGFAPTQLGELVVHKRKVEEVSSTIRRIIRKEGKSRILLLVGPTGCGKLVTLKMICRSLGLELLEWENDCTTACNFWLSDRPSYAQNPLVRFKQFILQSTRYRSVVSVNGDAKKPLLPCSHVTVVKDIPVQFYDQSNLLVSMLQNCLMEGISTPLVFVATDGSSGNSKTDWHRLFNKAAIEALNIEVISFNPFPPTVMTKCLRSILSKVPTLGNCKHVDIDAIVQVADGDLRVAINSLQFAVEHSSNTFTINQKDTSIPLFRASGKFLYGKFSTDQSITSEKDAALDRLSIEGCVAKCGVDEHLFCLYLFENYLDFRPDLEDVEHISSCYSFADCLTHWDVAESLYPYAGSIAARSVATFFSSENPKRFKKIRKPQELALHKQTEELNSHCFHLSQKMGYCNLFGSFSFAVDCLSYLLNIKSRSGRNNSFDFKKTIAAVEALALELPNEPMQSWNNGSELSDEELRIDEYD
ncbi:Cell cycle checkpoint protein RAD17 [Trichuris trichiura]|uniref:Cell cycle checkpoint protein RAD17 n=1 Tax=Trichuris trichiura TaxID=36087 RepID=A0A077YUK2_TRITR|nr:Cell cycle checkpoint protein RAD17 [Trichuris trichiura]